MNLIYRQSVLGDYKYFKEEIDIDKYNNQYNIRGAEDFNPETGESKVTYLYSDKEVYMQVLFILSELARAKLLKTSDYNERQTAVFHGVVNPKTYQTMQRVETFDQAIDPLSVLRIQLEETYQDMGIDPNMI